MACVKKRYFSRRNAKRFARQLRHTSPNLKPYRCTDCGFWHLTSQTTARKTFFRALEREGS